MKQILRVAPVLFVVFLSVFGIAKCVQILPEDQIEAESRHLAKFMPAGTILREVLESAEPGHGQWYIIEFRNQCWMISIRSTRQLKLDCPKYPQVQYRGKDGTVYKN